MMATQRLGHMLRVALPVRHGLSLHTRNRIAVSYVPLTQAARLAGVVAAPRAFSLWSSATEGNEAARKAVFERASEIAEKVEEVPSNFHERAHEVGLSVHDRLAQAEETVHSALTHEGESISHAAQLATTDMQELGLGGWSPSGLLQHLLDGVQYYTNLPWWATIIVVTCGIRLAIAPLLVYVQANSIRLSNIQPQMQAMIKDLEYAKSTGNQQEMQNAAINVRKLLSDNNCSPFKSLLLPAVQMPIFLSFYFALTGLAKAPLPALTTGGIAWFPDLTLADPYYALPIISSAMTLLVLETGAETGTTAMNQSSQARFMKNVLRGVTVLAAWLISSFPSAVLLYWSTTNTFSLFQLLALRTRFLKRLLRLPEKVEHPVKPHIKEKTFMENIRSSMNSGNARPSAATPVRRPSSAFYRKPQDTPEIMSQSRTRALDSLMSDDKSVKTSRASSAASELNQAEKQSRLAAARERRLRQRN